MIKSSPAIAADASARYDGLARLGHVLASPVRLAFLDILRDGSRNVEDLAAAAGVSNANASRHLQAMRAAGVVTASREGRHVRYRLSGGAVSRAVVALRKLAAALAVVAAGLALPSPVAAQVTDQLRREVAAIGVVEKLGAQAPRDAVFTDSEGKKVSLADLGGEPVLLSFNYTSCPRLCGLQLHGIARALRDAGWDGTGYRALAVSIDPDEKQEQLARYKQTVVREAGGTPAVDAGWRFVRGRKEDVDALADAVGFRYRYDPATGEFAHQATLVVLTGDGRVSGYLHGISYPKESLRAAVDRARAGAVATAEEQRGLGGFLLSCMGFDPADKAPLALRIMRIGGVLASGLLLAFLGNLAYRDVRRRRSEKPTP